MSPAAAMLIRLRAKMEAVRAVVDEELKPSRSVSLAQTKLDEAELWLARACAEQEPDEEPTPAPAERCRRCDHRGTDHYGSWEDSPRPCNHNACECSGWEE